MRKSYDLSIKNFHKANNSAHSRLIYGGTSQVRLHVAREMRRLNINYGGMDELYFDCADGGEVPLFAGTIIIDNVDLATKRCLNYLKDYMDARSNADTWIRLTFLSQSSLKKELENNTIVPGFYYNIVYFINAYDLYDAALIKI